MTRKTALQAILLAGALVVPPSLALAETGDSDPGRSDQQQSQNQQGQQQAGQRQGHPQIQRALLQELRADNQAEVTIARLGSEKASRQEVKQYAQKLVESHQQFMQRLQQAGQQASAGGQGQSDQQARADSDIQDAAQGAAQRAADTADAAARDVYGMARGESGAQSGQAGQLAQIHQEVCQQKAQSMRQYLNQQQGSDFDKAFLGAQILGHQAMIDKLEVYQRHVDSQTAGILKQAQQEARDHLQQAKSLMEQTAKAS